MNSRNRARKLKIFINLIKICFSKNSQFEHLSEKEREIFEYFQNKLNEKNKEVIN